jgi:hypothetical protein
MPFVVVELVYKSKLDEPDEFESPRMFASMPDALKAAERSARAIGQASFNAEDQYWIAIDAAGVQHVLFVATGTE